MFAAASVRSRCSKARSAVPPPATCATPDPRRSSPDPPGPPRRRPRRPAWMPSRPSDASDRIRRRRCIHRRARPTPTPGRPPPATPVPARRTPPPRPRNPPAAPSRPGSSLPSPVLPQERRCSRPSRAPPPPVRAADAELRPDGVALPLSSPRIPESQLKEHFGPSIVLIDTALAVAKACGAVTRMPSPPAHAEVQPTSGHTRPRAEFVANLADPAFLVIARRAAPTLPQTAGVRPKRRQMGYRMPGKTSTRPGVENAAPAPSLGYQ